MSTSNFIRDNYHAASSYSFTAVSPASAHFDLIYDLWIRLVGASGTIARGSSLTSNDLEITIALLNNGLRPTASWSRMASTLLDPLSELFESTPAEFECTASFNGRSSNSRWLSYFGHGGTAAQMVTFLLESPTPVAAGTLVVPLSAFVKRGLAEAGISDAQKYQIMGIEFGSEYGESRGPSSFSINWDLTHFSITKNNRTTELIP